MSEERKLQSYLFDVGNSSHGPLGFSIRVRAYDKDEAEEKIKLALPDFITVTKYLLNQTEEPTNGIEYMNVYFNQSQISWREHLSEVEDVTPE